ncbi:hypothetical protein MNBD_GAMMA22-1929 [hydrothermal vent metagenome]|uniref:SHOCT domain-containing protein n=1 Tax=hydrothermal vent metagenome TaxID=652676 RepID=A0A3B1APR4_9ZZZZ
MSSISGSMLYQNKLFHGKNNFVIKPGSHISIEQLKSRGKTKFDIDLIALSPDSHTRINLAWHWMVAMMITLAVIVATLAASQFITNNIILEYKKYFLLLVVMLFIIFTILFLVFSNRKRIFTTRHSKLPIVEILISNPNKSSYKSFIDGLENEIIISCQNRQLNQKQQRAGELKTLRRLSEQGFISKADYEQSKQILLHA